MMATKKRLLGLTLLLAAGMSLAGCMGDDTESTPGDDTDMGDDVGLGNDTTNGGDAGAGNDTLGNETADGNATGNDTVVGEGNAPQAPPTFPPEEAANPDGDATSGGNSASG